ncbi:hypothetical protein ACVIHD_001483 [Bradyrhizobium embrapense]
MLGDDVAYLPADRLVDFEAGLHENQVRSLPPCGDGRHRRADPKFPGFVADGRHDAALGGSADRDRFVSQARIVPLFDGRVERVHAVSSARGERSRLLRKPFKIDELQAAIRGLLEP